MSTATVEGVVARIQWSSPVTGFAIVKLRHAGQEVTAVGELASVHPGDTIEVSGRWDEHSKYGRQIRVESWCLGVPRGADGVIGFLAKADGVGQEIARRIVATLGDDAIDRIAEDPGCLAGIDGIGPKRVAGLAEAIRSQTARDRVLIALQKAGATARLANLVMVHCEERQIEDPVNYLMRRPYELCAIHGVGFKTADVVAMNLGVDPASSSRIRSGVLYTLDKASDGGDCGMTRTTLFRSAARLLGLKQTQVDAEVGVMLEDRVLVAEYGLVFEASMAALEQRVADLVQGFSRTPVEPVELVEPQGIELSEEQRGAVASMLMEPVAILSGGPGTGKTTITRALLNSLTRAGVEFTLCSPTGRAARRLEEATGFRASTIHRALGYSGRFQSWEYGGENKLPTEAVVVDEASMVDLALFWRVLDAMPEGCRLYLVGDADQLPSVGPGRVLRDLMESGAVPTSMLTRIFRQAAGSRIIQGAHRVLSGKPPETSNDPGADDLFLVEGDDPEELQGAIVDMVVSRIPAHFKIHPADVQVIVPMHKGALGTKELNSKIQERLNPGGQKVKGTTLRRGDRVMQTKNDYALEVFNGETGRLVSWDGDYVRVDFGDRVVCYPMEKVGPLRLAYACTIHKSQGSEYEAVVLALARQHTIMLQRTLFYTALTRARRLAIVVGDRESLATAARRVGGDDRKTALSQRISPAVSSNLALDFFA